MKKELFQIQAAEKKLIISNHLLYNVYPLIKQKKLLLNIFENIKSSLKIFKQLNPNIKNQKTFYDILKISDFQNKSVMEFKRQDKIIILSKNLEIETITEEKMKEFIEFSKKALLITKSKIQKYIKTSKSC